MHIILYLINFIFATDFCSLQWYTPSKLRLPRRLSLQLVVAMNEIARSGVEGGTPKEEQNFQENGDNRSAPRNRGVGKGTAITKGRNFHHPYTPYKIQEDFME